MRRLLLAGKGPIHHGTRAWGLVGVADMRRRPSHRSELVSQFVMGTELRLIGSRGEWKEVITPDGYSGWCTGGAVAEVAAGWRGLRASPRGVLTPFVTWIRESPRRWSPALAEVVHGTELPLVGVRTSWWEVALPSGERGWLPQSSIAPAPRKTRSLPRRSSVATRALGFRGCPYLWGGTTPKGFDCSGLVQTVFRLEGLLLPRDSWQQHKVATSLPPGAEARAGDLLFFGSRRGTIDHVAISLGEGLFIHCSGRVRVDSISPSSSRYSPTLAPRFRGAGSVLSRGAQR